MYRDEHTSPETHALMQGAPAYEPSPYYASFPPYAYPDYHYPPPPSSQRSFHSEPRHSFRGRQSSPDTHHSAQYSSSRRYIDYRREAPYYFDYASFRDEALHVPPYSREFSASAGGGEHYPGSTPPQVGAYDTPAPLENVEAPLTLKSEEGSGLLKPDEGFDSPPYHNESSLHGEDDREQPSIPDKIYLSDQYIPSPDINTFHDSPISTVYQNQTNSTETAPQIPLFNRSETNRSDVANSSSNSSSLGASTESSSDFGWTRHYQALVQYKQKNGNCCVPQKHSEGRLNLGVWVNKVSLSTCLGKSYAEYELTWCDLCSNEWRGGSLLRVRSLR
jgi:hypothetical protein